MLRPTRRSDNPAGLFLFLSLFLELGAASCGTAPVVATATSQGMRSEGGRAGRFTDWERVIKALSGVGSVAGARKCEAVGQYGKGDREGEAPALILQASCLFPSGGTGVSESGRPAISAIAAELRDIKDREFWVAARASEAPGGERLNRARAQAVVTALIGAGVSARRLMAIVGFDDGSQSASRMPAAFAGSAVIEIVAAPAPLLP